MTLEVEEFKQTEQKCAYIEESLRCPYWCSVIRVQEEVHVENAKENPIMSRILKDVHKGHGVIAKSMHQYCLKLSLYVVK